MRAQIIYVYPMDVSESASGSEVPGSNGPGWALGGESNLLPSSHAVSISAALPFWFPQHTGFPNYKLFFWVCSLLWIPGWRSAYLWGDDPTSHNAPHSHVAYTLWLVSSSLALPNTKKFYPWIPTLVQSKHFFIVLFGQWALDWSFRDKPTLRLTFQVSWPTKYQLQLFLKNQSWYDELTLLWPSILITSFLLGDNIATICLI